MTAIYIRNRAKIKYQMIVDVVALIIVFCFSYFFSSAYQLGDQVFYRDFYLSLAQAPIDEIPLLQSFYTGSGEPLFGLIAWVGAKLSIEKDIYFSLINTIFGFALLRFLQNNAANTFYIILVFLNYYVFVMFAPAERLKISFLFMLIAINVKSRPAMYVFIFGALLSHFQTLILLGSRFVGLIAKIPLRIVFKKRTIVKLFVGAVALSIITAWLFSIFFSILLSKIEAYDNEHGILSILNIAVLMLSSFLVFKEKTEILCILAATAVAASILGPERINMMAFSIFSYFVVKQRRTRHPIVLSLMIYFAVKGVMFTSDVFNYGTGY